MASSLRQRRRCGGTRSKRTRKIFETVQAEKRSELVCTRGEAGLLRRFHGHVGLLHNRRAVGGGCCRAAVRQDSWTVVVFLLAARGDLPPGDARGSLDFNSSKPRVWSRALGSYASDFGRN